MAGLRHSQKKQATRCDPPIKRNSRLTPLRFAKPEVAQFHIAEFVSLHDEIRDLNIEARSLEQQSDFAIGTMGMARISWYGYSV